MLEWTVTEQLRSGLATLRDHHFQLPDKKLEFPDPTSISRGDNSNLEIYDYPGDYAKLFKSRKSGSARWRRKGQRSSGSAWSGKRPRTKRPTALPTCARSVAGSGSR